MFLLLFLAVVKPVILLHYLSYQKGLNYNQETCHMESIVRPGYRVAQKNGATLFHCKYSENPMTELHGNW